MPATPTPTPTLDRHDTGPGRDPVRIRTASPSAAPLVVKASGRGSVTPLRFGGFLVAPGDRVALRHLLEHHLPATTRRERWERATARAALERGFEGIAGAVLSRRLGARTPGPLEVEAVWEAVRATLKSCGLTGVSVRVHRLEEPAAGLGYGGDLVGFGRRGGALEASHPLVVVRVRPRGSVRTGLAPEARALATLRGALPSAWRDLVPAPLAHRVADKVEVLATGFLPGRALDLDLPRRPSAAAVLHPAVAVAGTLADLQNAVRHDGLAAGEVVPDEALEAPWAAQLRERLDVRPVPLVPSHGALSPRTILFDGDRVSGLVDWSEHGGAELPTRDLFDFLMAYSRRLEGRRGRDPVKLVGRAFVRRTRVSRAIRQALVAYGERRELGLPTLGGLFRLHLLAAASGDGARGLPSSDAERAAVFRVLDRARETVFTP